MCRWSCETTDTTYMCKWCGIRYCRQCLRGDFFGLMTEPTTCALCRQKRCQGTRVEYFQKKVTEDDGKKKKSGGNNGKSKKKKK